MTATETDTPAAAAENTVTVVPTPAVAPESAPAAPVNAPLTAAEIEARTLNYKASALGQRAAGRGATKLKVKDFPVEYNRWLFRVALGARKPTEAEVAERAAKAKAFFDEGKYDEAAAAGKAINNLIPENVTRTLKELRKDHGEVEVLFTKDEFKEKIMAALDKAVDAKGKATL